MHPRHSRRSLRFAIGALLLALPVLTSCGEYATDRVNAITAGTSNQDGTVDVLNALVVAAHPDSGTLVGELSNNDNDNEVVLTSVTSGEDGASAEFEPIEIAPAGRAELADAGIRIEGTFEAGEFIDLTLTFDNGDEVAMSVPVVTACGQYEGLDDAPGSRAEDEAIAYSCEPEEAPEH